VQGNRRTTCFSRHRNIAKARAFTLLELLLVIVIMCVLSAIVWPNMTGRRASETIKNKANQLAALLMFARSGSMSTGYQYRCVFELKGKKAVIEVESNPLEKPGEFEAVEGSWAKVDLGESGIACKLVQFNKWDNELKEEEANLLESNTQTQNDDDETLAPILFYPDGTSDSARVLLGDEESNYITLSVNGMTGEVKIECGNKIDIETGKK
jgi:prepilin-type N-terminal cleavage/methylation domain-containing protein